MLDIINFDIIDNMLYYIGSNEYIITTPDRTRRNYSVSVTALDEDGEPYTVGTYAASTLSTAIAIVERMEAGEAE